MSEMQGVLTPRSHAHHYGPTRHADHYVYRCYDKDGDLIYIGCTSNVARRIAAHRRGSGGAKASRWLSIFMDRYDVEGPYPGRDAGQAAEAAAINFEQPLFNYQNRANLTQAAWMTRSAIAEYLVERGHTELAVETVCSCERGIREIGGYWEHCVAHVAAQEAGITDLRSSATFTEADWEAVVA